jgi:hypothetical protein
MVSKPKCNVLLQPCWVGFIHLRHSFQQHLNSSTAFTFSLPTHLSATVILRNLFHRNRSNTYNVTTYARKIIKNAGFLMLASQVRSLFSGLILTCRHEAGTQAAVISSIAGMAVQKMIKIKCLTPYTILPSIFLSSFSKGSMM